jgi:hypothetical protein
VNYSRAERLAVLEKVAQRKAAVAAVESK